MYERFTDRSRKVLQLANQEAMRFNHERIGTEHILLGLVKEGSGVAANVLKNFDIDLRKIRLEVEKILQPGPDKNEILMGKLPQTDRAKRVIQLAVEEAKSLNHNYVGTEHLLLGVLAEGDGIACQVLANFGLKLEEVREEVLFILGLSSPSEEAANLPKPLTHLKEWAATVAVMSRPLLDISALRKIEAKPGDTFALELPVDPWRDDEFISRFKANLREMLGFDVKLMVMPLGAKLHQQPNAKLAVLLERVSFALGPIVEEKRDAALLALQSDVMLAQQELRDTARWGVSPLVKEIDAIGQALEEKYLKEKPGVTSFTSGTYAAWEPETIVNTADEPLMVNVPAPLGVLNATGIFVESAPKITAEDVYATKAAMDEVKKASLEECRKSNEALARINSNLSESVTSAADVPVFDARGHTKKPIGKATISADGNATVELNEEGRRQLKAVAVAAGKRYTRLLPIVNGRDVICRVQVSDSCSDWRCAAEWNFAVPRPPRLRILLDGVEVPIVAERTRCGPWIADAVDRTSLDGPCIEAVYRREGEFTVDYFALDNMPNSRRIRCGSACCIEHLDDGEIFNAVITEHRHGGVFRFHSDGAPFGRYRSLLPAKIRSLSRPNLKQTWSEFEAEAGSYETLAGSAFLWMPTRSCSETPVAFVLDSTAVSFNGEVFFYQGEQVSWVRGELIQVPEPLAAVAEKQGAEVPNFPEIERKGREAAVKWYIENYGDSEVAALAECAEPPKEKAEEKPGERKIEFRKWL